VRVRAPEVASALRVERSPAPPYEQGRHIDEDWFVDVGLSTGSAVALKLSYSFFPEGNLLSPTGFLVDD
jgi:hypothetical protein